MRDEVYHCGTIATRIDEDTYWCEFCESAYLHSCRRWFDPKQRERPVGKQNRVRPLNSWLTIDEPYERDYVAQALVARSQVEPLSLSEVGVALGTTREAVRILQGGAMRKLRLRLSKMAEGQRILHWLAELEAERRDHVYPET